MLIALPEREEPMVSWIGAGGGVGLIFVIVAVIVGAVIVWASVHPVRPTLPCGRRGMARTSARVVSRRHDANREMGGLTEGSIRICSCSDRTCIIVADPDVNPDQVSG